MKHNTLNNTLTVHSEEAEHEIEFPQGISSIDIDGVRLLREASQTASQTVSQTKRLVWIFGICALLGLSLSIYCGVALLDKMKLLGMVNAVDSYTEHPLVINGRPPDRDSFYGVKDLPDLAIRSGKWKLLCEYDGSDARLYDLTKDRGEKNNLAKKHPKIVKELSQKVIAWHKSMPN